MGLRDDQSFRYALPFLLGFGRPDRGARTGSDFAETSSASDNVVVHQKAMHR
jgi:hypothetical protein